jgi:hypothetical protein
VSPFERPLTTPELDAFSRGFTSRRVRAFSLPFVNAAQTIPALNRYVHAAYEYDRKLLARIPALTPYAGIRVVELTK